MNTPPRDRVFSIRMTDAEMEYLDQLAEVHAMDRSALMRHLILSAPLWRVTTVEPPPGPIAPPAPLVLRQRTPEERAAYLAAKRAEWVAAGKDPELIDLIAEVSADG